jgi:hypothetical protein
LHLGAQYVSLGEDNAREVQDILKVRAVNRPIVG